MALEVINVGANPNDGQGDPLRTAYIKCNNNFRELYSRYQQNVPTSSIGSVGDTVGMYASSSSSFYYCFADYDGSSTIWAEIQTIGNISATQILNGTSSIKIQNLNGNANVSIAGVSNVAVFTSSGILVGGVVSASGNIQGGNLRTAGQVSAAGNITGNYILGNGSQLTGLPATYTNANVAAYLPTYTGDITGNVISTSGNITGAYILGNGSQLTGLPASYSNANVANYLPTYSGAFTAASVSASGNITGGNISTSGTISTQGNVLSQGIMSAIGNIVTAGYFVGNFVGNISGNITVPGSNTQVLFNTNGNVNAVGGFTYDTAGPNLLTVLGTISSQGNIVTGNVNTGGAIDADKTITGGNLATAGTVSAAGNITGAYIFGNGSQLTGIAASYGNANVANYLPTYSGNISSGNITTTGLVSATGNITGGNISATNHTGTTVSVSGNITGGNISATNHTGTTVSVSGNVSGNYFIGNGSQLTGIASSYGDSNVTTLLGTFGSNSISTTGNINSGIISATGTATVGNLSTSGTVSATGNGTFGNITTAGIVSATGNVITGGTASATGTGTFGNVATAGTVSATGTVTGGNIATAGTVSATGNITGGNISATIGSFSGNINMNNQYINNVTNPVQNQDVATKAYVDQQISTGVAYHPAVAAATTGTLAAATGGTMAYVEPNGAGNGVGAKLTTTGSYTTIDTVNVASVGTRILVKNEANAAWNGVYTYANATSIVRSTDTDEYGPDSTEDLSVNDYFFVSGGGTNIGTAFVVSAPTGTITFGTSNITFSTFSTSQVYAAGTGLSLNSTTFSVNASQTQITSVGTLGSLSVTGTTTSGNLATGGTASATGNIITAGTLTVNSGGAVTAIVNGAANGVGNIGSSSKYFNTVFAQSTSALYADLAENYQSDENYVPGTVLSFGGSKEVTISLTDADPMVAGVVSTDPAYLMNSNLEGDYIVAIALAGRVPCQVQGPIKRGQMLVSNGNGRARAETNPAIGTVVGKALESFDGDIGTIEIVIGRL